MIRHRGGIVAPALVTASLLASCASGGSPEAEQGYNRETTPLEMVEPRSADNPICQEWPEGLYGENGHFYDGPTGDSITSHAVPILTNEALSESLAQYFEGLPVVVKQPGELLLTNTLLDTVIELQPEAIAPPTPEVIKHVSSAVAHLQARSSEDETFSLGSGFLVRTPTGSPQLMTAGHVLDEVAPEDLVIELNDGTPLEFDYYTYAFNDPWKQEGLSIEEKARLSEDVAKVEVCYQADFSDRALPVRDQAAFPLRIGEPLLLMNFQDNHETGNPAIYQVIYTGPSSIDPLFGTVIGDVIPGQEEDEIRFGASGGVVVDQHGAVVGMSTASINNYNDTSKPQWHWCDAPIGVYGAGIAGTREAYIDMIVPGTNDECENGISYGTYRTVQSFGGFLMNQEVEPVLEINPEFIGS